MPGTKIALINVSYYCQRNNLQRKKITGSQPNSIYRIHMESKKKKKFFYSISG